MWLFRVTAPRISRMGRGQVPIQRLCLTGLAGLHYPKERSVDPMPSDPQPTRLGFLVPERNVTCEVEFPRKLDLAGDVSLRDKES